jgi:Alcohol dehydrogenase GroES-like domain
MKAIRFDRYGSADVLELRDIDIPAVGDDELLVRVRAPSVNPLDWHFMRGTPYVVRLIAGLPRPKASARKLGADMAGSVEAAGKRVTSSRPGDEVFGGLEERGALAEYLTISADGAVLTKPASLTFEQAAAVPVADVDDSVPQCRERTDRSRRQADAWPPRIGSAGQRQRPGPRRPPGRPAARPGLCQVRARVHDEPHLCPQHQYPGARRYPRAAQPAPGMALSRHSRTG